MSEHQSTGSLRSAEFRQRFLRRYDGPYEPSEALWWLEHPGTPSPGGQEPPDERLVALRRALFAPTASAEDSALYEAQALRTASHARALSFAVAAADSADAHAVQSKPADDTPRSARVSMRGPALTAGLLVVGLLVGFLAGRAAGSPSAHPTLSPSPVSSVAAADLPVLPELSTPGRVLLRMSNASPQVGGTLPESGTSAYQSDLVDQSHGRLRLIVECVGGDGLLVVPGSNGLVDNYDITLQCPANQVAAVQTFIAPAVSGAPFRIVVYERQPVEWKLLLAVDPAG